MNDAEQITITLTVRLDPARAYHLAQFLKRVSFTTAARHVDDGTDEQAYCLLAAFTQIQKSLAKNGIAPR